MFTHLYKRIIEVIFVIATGLKLRCCCLLEVTLKYPDGESEHVAAASVAGEGWCGVERGSDVLQDSIF